MEDGARVLKWSMVNGFGFRKIICEVCVMQNEVWRTDHCVCVMKNGV